MRQLVAVVCAALCLVLVSCGSSSVLDLPVSEAEAVVSSRATEQPPTVAEVQQAATAAERAASRQAELLAVLPARCGVAAVSRQLGCEPSSNCLVQVHVPGATRRQAAYRWVLSEPNTLEVVARFDFTGATVRSGGLQLDGLSVSPQSQLPSPWLLLSMGMSHLDHDSQREWHEFADVLARQ